ncbi:MAG: flagellin, partial [Selenomonadaceae bacterium]|nr:flagellin [Selenomonadaceae bacterium]
MGMVVKNNMSAVRTLNTLNSNTSALQKSLQKVSSGMKINSAQDDASGYAISERMRVRIRSLDQANQNSQNDSSLMKTAEGAVGNTVEILRALKEKAINAANDSNTDEDRQTIQKEINQFIDQIDDNALVQFNGKYLVDGSKNNAFYKTKSILLNQSLEVGTRSTSALTDLNNRAGDSLGIQTTDKYQVSWVQNGTVTVISGDVGTKTISEILTLKNTAGDQISQVKATDASGLISGANEEEEEATPLYTISAEDADDLENGSADAKALLAAYQTYCVNAGLTDGDAVPLDDITDSSNNRLYSSDGKEGSFTNVTIQKDANTNKYTLTLPTGATELEIYSYEEQPVTYPAGTNAEPVTDGYTTYNAGGPAGTLLSSLPDALKNIISTNTTALSDLTPPSAGDNIGDFTVPTNATYIQWTVLDANDDEVTDGTSYAVRSMNNATDNKDYLIMYTDNTAGTAATAGYKIGVKFTIPPEEEETNAAESGLEDAWDKFGKAVYTPDKTEGIAFGATVADVNHQISGLTVNILDQNGNVKKAANAALDQF